MAIFGLIFLLLAPLEDPQTEIKGPQLPFKASFDDFLTVTCTSDALENKKFHVYEVVINAFKTSTTLRGEEGAVAKIYKGVNEKVSDHYNLIIAEKDGLFTGYQMQKPNGDLTYLHVYVHDFELFIWYQ